jgi:hypothetical protein
MILDHYQQTKNLLVSYSPKALGFFRRPLLDELVGIGVQGG